MPSSQVKIALLQLAVHGGELSRNLDNARAHIAKAASQGADIAVLPECMDLGWTHPSSQDRAAPIPEGIACQTLMQAAQEHKIMVCAGITERDAAAVYNAAVLIDSDGTLLAKHRKINELTCAHHLYANGDRLNVVSTCFGTIGLMICADGFAHDQVLSRSLGYMGADFILSPCAWAVDADHDNATKPYGDWWRQNYGPVAQEFAMPILGVSNVGPITAGPWTGRVCIGCSLAVGTEAQDLAFGPYGVDAECIVFVDITTTPRPAQGTGWQERARSASHQAS